MTSMPRSRDFETSDFCGEYDLTPSHPQLPLQEEVQPDEDDDTPLELDDEHWQAFWPDDDEIDPLPEPGDFWIEFDQHELPPIAA